MTSTIFEKVNDIFQCKLNLEDKTEFTIPLREDGYIHATALCKASKKRVNHWLSLSETKKLVKKVEEKLRNNEATIPASQNEKQLIEVYKGNTSKYSQGTWIHPDLGINLAQWCCPSFSLQVSQWIRELIFTDKVEIGKEKNDEEISNSLIEKLKNAENLVSLLENENKDIIKKYNKLYTIHQTHLKRKDVHKLRQGPCVYLVNMDENNTVKPIKVGHSGNITERVSRYRTPNPYCKLLYTLYTNENVLIENMMKKKYQKELYANNSECITGVDVEILIKDIEDMCKMLNLDYTLETQEEIDEFNRNIVPIENIDEIEEHIIEVDTNKSKRCGGLHHETEESRILPLDHFFKNKSNSDGFSRLCKECYLIGRYGDERKKRKVVVIPKFDILTHKWCNRCENVREHNEFYKDGTTIDGLGANCKQCKKDQKQKYNQKLKEAVEEFNKNNEDIEVEIEYNKETHKKCSQCNDVKELNNFNKRKKSKDGLSYECKDCKKKYKDKKPEEDIEYNIETHKKCKDCKSVKELTDFYKDGNSIKNNCKECVKKNQSERVKIKKNILNTIKT